MNTYTTRDEAVTREIIEPLGEYVNEHDTDAIAEEVIVTTGEGTELRYRINEDVDFWEVVAANAK